MNADAGSRTDRTDGERSRRPLAAVVVPAHNEAGLIGAALDALLATADPGEFDVVVVANGCHDSTADVARARGVRVVETGVSGKANALRVGDAFVTVFPRVYLDADVRLGTADVRRMVEALSGPGVLACAPSPVWDTDGVGPLALRVHRVHELLVGPRRALAGAGAYMLSPEGHERVFPVPDVISDDGWVHRQFSPGERAVVANAHTIVRPSASLASNLRRRGRLRRGNDQLVELGLPAPDGPLRLAVLTHLVRSRRVPVGDALVYTAVVMVDRVSTRLRGRGAVHWATGSGR